MDTTTKRQPTKPPLISVIVPIYNTKEYLEKCLNSLREQTLYDIEIIMIDDGSTDGSENYCDTLVEIDSRFKVLHKKNEGLAAARNDGIRISQAKFIMFLDSDDWVEPDFCEGPYKAAIENEADIVVFRYFRSTKNKSVAKRRFPQKGLVPEKEVQTRLWPYVDAVVWNKLYRREMFNDIQYPFGHLCEDYAVTHRVIHGASRIVLLNKCLYHHISGRNGSITYRWPSEFIEDYILFSIRRINDLNQWGYDYRTEEIKTALFYLIVKGRTTELSSKYERILQQDRYFMKSEVSWKWKAMYFTYRVSPRLFDYIAIKKRKRQNYSNTDNMDIS